ncbi:hypothetical protein HYT18_05035 [Candidatus Microgenomates bacterium]|nr:hypothetical protein [Candidatus Microgenomates bacterium]
MEDQKIIYPKPAKVRIVSNPIPQQDLEPRIEEQEKKLKFLQRFLEFNIGLNMVIGAALLFVIIFLIAWRFDLIGYFQKGRESQNTQSLPAITAPVIAQEDSEPPYVFINEQGLNVEEAFQAPPDNLRLTISGQLKKEVLGFLPYWVIEKSDEIDISLLTSVSYFGLEVDGDGNIIKTDASGKQIDPWFHFISNPAFDKFVKRAKRNKTKVYVTMKAFNQANIVKLVTNPQSSTNFVNNALYLMNSKSLDGINVDFEYIGTPDQKVIDGFSVLITNLNRELKREYPNAVLTVDTFVDAASATRIHDIPILSQNSDAIVIMGYDFHTPNSSSAGPVAPIEGAGLSIRGLIASYLEKAPAEKLILGVPYYGYDWPVVSNRNSQVAGSRADVRIYPYAVIAENSKKVQINWDQDSQTPSYIYTDPQTNQARMVHFENPRSLGIKYDFINQKELGGVGIWALGYDGKRVDLWQLIADKFAN